MKATSRLSAALLVSCSVAAAAHAQSCAPGQNSVCGPCDQPCEPYWGGMVSDSRPTNVGSTSSDPGTLVFAADAKPGYSRLSKRDAAKPLSDAVQAARFDSAGRLVSGKEAIQKAIVILRDNYPNDPFVGFIDPNLASDSRLDAAIKARVMTLNRLLAGLSKKRITLY